MRRTWAVGPLVLLAVAGCRMDGRDAGPGPQATPAAPNATAAPAGSKPPASSGAPAAAPSERPASVPVVTKAPVVLAEGTALSITLSTTVASDKNQPGDPVIGKLAAAVKDGERILAPAGSEVRGEVLAAEGSGRVKGRAHLSVAFMKLVVDGKAYDLQTSPISATAESGKKKDAKIVGGSAAAGALIGAIADGGSGAAKGALIGGAAGGGAVLATKGKEVVFSAGSKHTVTLKGAVRLD